jgi:DhnA family fructose-bisphosphate aldolase class Ia
MKSFRLKRLFNAKSNRCFDVAVDHGFFNQAGFLQGIEDMRTVVKTLVEATDDVSIYHKVIDAASGIPVLVRGGGRVSDREILERTQGLLQQGASGIVYGRNVIQHPNPKGITRALMAMVHDGASVDDALAMV